MATLGLDDATRTGMLALGPQRLVAYHHMVHSRIFRTTQSFLGGAAQWMGPDRLHEEIHTWVRSTGPDTCIFRDVPADFVTWSLPRWAQDPDTPDWLGPLAELEVGKRMVRNDPRPNGVQSEAPIDLDRGIATNPTTLILRFDWAIHPVPSPLPTDFDPEPGHFAVACFRQLDDRVYTQPLKPRSAALLTRLIAGQTLREALFGACEDVGETLDDDILGQTALSLAKYIDLHLLLGGAA